MKKLKWNFRTGYLIYVLILVVLLFALFLYVRSTMIRYENSGAEQYVLELVKKADSSGSVLAKYMEKNCFDASSFSGKLGDPAERKNRFQELIASDTIEVKEAAGSYDAKNPVFEVTADGKPFLTIQLSEGDSKTLLGIMTISTWDIRACILRNPDSGETSLKPDEAGGTTYYVSVPYDFTLEIDGTAVTGFVSENETDEQGRALVGNGVLEGTLSEIEEFAYVAPYTEVPMLLNLELTGLTFEPVFTVRNNGNEAVGVSLSGGTVKAEAEFCSTKEAEEIGSAAVDALTIGETWSKFMTNDVGGKSHGLEKVRTTCLLIPGSDLYEKATAWAGNVDISFVSAHSIDGFTEESVSNYVLYSEDLFSVDVYFKKNMTLTKTGNRRTDVFHNRMFFVYNRDSANGEPGWRLADMCAL